MLEKQAQEKGVLHNFFISSVFKLFLGETGTEEAKTFLPLYIYIRKTKPPSFGMNLAEHLWVGAFGRWCGTCLDLSFLYNQLQLLMSP